MRHRMPLFVNNRACLADVAALAGFGAGGPSGYIARSLPFMIQEPLSPAKKRAAALYRGAASRLFHPLLPVTMRSLDIGRDKALDLFSDPRDNPFLGWRGYFASTAGSPGNLFLVQNSRMLKASKGLETTCASCCDGSVACMRWKRPCT